MLVYKSAYKWEEGVCLGFDFGCLPPKVVSFGIRPV